jgi:hypothetical protein
MPDARVGAIGQRLWGRHPIACQTTPQVLADAYLGRLK